MKLRDRIFSQFDASVAVSLIEFGKSLRYIDADVLIFLARKSLCVYDMLVDLGIPPADNCVVSDRILDLRLDALKGKRVALIDDTIILGTSLAKAKLKINNSVDSKVTVHAFCVDKDNYCKELVAPDSVSLWLPESGVMAFSTAEVRALSLLPRPYIVDFPITTRFSIKREEARLLFQQKSWHGVKISTRLQAENNVTVLSFFSTTETTEELKSKFGEALFSAIDLLKVRVFARATATKIHIKIVPIVTLHSLKQFKIEQIYELILRRYEQAGSGELIDLRHFCVSVQAKLRFVQYVMSLVVGESFARSVRPMLRDESHIKFDVKDCVRHYGPWLQDDITRIHIHVNSAFDAPPPRLAPQIFSRSGVSIQVTKWAKEFLPRSARLTKRTNINKFTPTPNLLADLTGVFVNMYEKRELPARDEVRRVGTKWLDESINLLHRDRLESGIPWSILVDWLAKRNHAGVGTRVKNIASLLLDLCNDLGICVPITSVRDGIVFRAYRHGENVRFSESELALAWHLVKGYTDTANRPDVPRLTLEKMLVLLFKIGVARKFLEPLFGTGGTEGVGKVEFDLKGARPKLESGPLSKADRSIWLTEYLVKRRVLKTNRPIGSSTGTYQTNERPVGNFLVPYADDEATELGELIGLLMKSSDSSQKVLDDSALTLLATCSTPHYTAKALITELHIFQCWYEEGFRIMLDQVKWNEVDSVRSGLDTLIGSHGHEAVHSARLKYTGYIRGDVQSIVKRCHEFLSATSAIKSSARRWKSYWQDIDDTHRDAERLRFNPLISKSGKHVLVAAACISALEIALSFQLNILSQPQKPTKHLRNALAKMRDFRADMRAHGIEEPIFVTKMGNRLDEIASLGQTSSPTDAERLLLANDGGQSLLVEFHPKQVAEFVHAKLKELNMEIIRHVELTESFVEDHGLIGERYNMQYVLYYDVFDSTATKENGDVVNYRALIAKFKKLVNTWIIREERECMGKDYRVFCQLGSKYSTNDCKHIFFGGSIAIALLANAIRVLVETAYALGRVHVRMLAVPCDFMNSTAYLEELNPEVQGSRFWEYFSRLKKGTDKIEKSYAPTGLKTSFLSVATDLLKMELNLSSLHWQPTMQVLQPEIEQLQKPIPVYYNDITVPK